MKHNIKNYLEQVYPGCEVTLKRINYRKDGSLSRTILISPHLDHDCFLPDDDLDPKLELLAEACPVQADGHYCSEQHVDFEVDGSGNQIVKVYVKDLTWQEYEERVVDLIDWYEWDDDMHCTATRTCKRPDCGRCDKASARKIHFLPFRARRTARTVMISATTTKATMSGWYLAVPRRCGKPGVSISANFTVTGLKNSSIR